MFNSLRYEQRLLELPIEDFKYHVPRLFQTFSLLRYRKRGLKIQIEDLKFPKLKSYFEFLSLRALFTILVEDLQFSTLSFELIYIIK